MLVKFDIPHIAPDVIIQISNLTKEADVKFASGTNQHKKAWIKEKAMPLFAKVELKKIPSWLQQPIKEAAISIIVDSIWALSTSE